MIFARLKSIELASNDIAIAVFCVAIAVLVAITARHLRANKYFKYFAASFSLFFLSNAASVIKSADPTIIEPIEHITMLLSMLVIVAAAYVYRREGEQLHDSSGS